ncbi:translesion error-prone DNA polymerase V subunit UmuC [Pseudaeromonas paramecii]|uniref:Translesion error-prone DNA polymerase V subunit UmuC n=1 Tax=Pseudaeromonas paramecii TaxID=2138166 RepID=A0ABP8PZ41_9GAMM
MSCWALVDVNNFYASCERLFRPDLQGRPLVVLSNNDGCVVSRSPEAKALGVKMAEPFYRIQAAFTAQGGVWFSSNYTLYGDLSARVMSLLEQAAPEVHLYSIDEAFLRLEGPWLTDATEHARRLRQQIQQWTGLTVGIGLGPSPTLAKLANYAAKRWPATGGVVDLQDANRRQRLLAITPVEEVWGIGQRLGQALQREGIHTAGQLANAPAKGLRSRYGVTLERVVRELGGQAAGCLAAPPPVRQQVLCSRTFGERITQRPLLREALVNHLVRAAERLRGAGLCCRHLGIFIRTSAQDSAHPFYGDQASITLPAATDDSLALLAWLDDLLGRLWRPGHAYHKAGVVLSDLSPRQFWQGDLFDGQDPKRMRLMQVMDSINQRHPHGLKLAAQGSDQAPWQMRQAQRSPSYTTAWAALPLAYC